MENILIGVRKNGGAMKKTIVAALIITFSFLSIEIALAQDKEEKKISQVIAVEAQVDAIDKGEAAKNEKSLAAAQEAAAVSLELANKNREEELKKAKEKLSKQEWVIYLFSLADRKAMGTDILTFSEGKVSAKGFSLKGYQQSNCTLTAQDGEAIIWETMQANAKGGIIFWRGELRNNFMQGMISLQPKDGKNQDISFSTIAPKPQEEKIKPKKVLHNKNGKVVK